MDEDGNVSIPDSKIDDDEHDHEQDDDESKIDGITRVQSDGYSGPKELNYVDMVYENGCKQNGKAEFICCFEAPGDGVVCGAKRGRRNDLKRHYMGHYTGRMPYRCNFCGKEFKSKGGVEDHVRSTHRENHWIECDVCT